MNTEKRLYRSRNALVGGVCAGVAEYFSFDPLVARILTVAFTLSTAGLFAVAYVALWVILPLAPNEAGPVEVEPHSVHSDTYGSVDVGASRTRADDAARAASEVAAARQHLPYDAYAGTGHVPPEPPTAEVAAWAQRAQCQVPSGWQAPGWEAPGWQSPNWQAPPRADHAPAGGGASSVPGGSAEPQQAGVPNGWRAPDAASAPPPAWGPQRNAGVKAAVFVGSFLLFFGIAALLAENIDGIAWWQFWPLVLAIIGIVQMVVPGPPGHRMIQFVDGLMLFSLGSTLLFFSLGLVGWASLQLMFLNLWPLLLMMVGFFIIGGALHAPWWTLLAGLCFVAFCVLGMLWFSVPGPNDLIVLTLPYGREFVIPFEVGVAVVR